MNKNDVSNWRIFTFIFGFTRPHWPLPVFGTLLYCSQSVMFSFVNMVLMRGVTAAIMQRSNSLLPQTVFRTFGLLILTLIMACIGILLYVSGELKTTRRLQKKLFRVFVNADAENRAHSGDLLSTLNTDVAGASAIYSDALTEIMNCILPMIIISMTLFSIDLHVSIFTITAGIIALIGQYVFAKPLAKIASKSLVTIADVTKKIGDIFGGGLIARAFNMERFLLNDFEKDNTKLLELNHREANMNAGQRLFSGLSEILTVGGVFVLGSILISRNQLNVVTLMAMIPLCESVSRAIAQIGTAFASIQGPLEAGRRIYNIVGGDNRVEPLPKRIAPVFDKYDIEIDNITFSYKDADTPVIQNFSLSIPENTYVSFVGESGCGKSTLLKVIAGLYIRDDISIILGGKKMTATDLDIWRSYFSYVDQSCTLFDLTIAENIALGKTGVTGEEIRAAAIEAGADTFIQKLQQGYDTPVGQVGNALSGGQRQRIAIARALIRRSPILVFDEPTASLDKQTEAEVIAAIESLRGKFTILMITHNNNAINPDMVIQL